MAVSKTTINFWVDFSLLLIFVALLAVTGVMIFVFPRPSASSGWAVGGMTYDAWALAQGVLIAVFALDVLLHLILHWSWVCGVVTHRFLSVRGKPAAMPDGIKTLYGVGTLVVVLTVVAGVIAWAEFAVRQS
jgi:hypothetical protein